MRYLFRGKSGREGDHVQEIFNIASRAKVQAQQRIAYAPRTQFQEFRAVAISFEVKRGEALVLWNKWFRQVKCAGVLEPTSGTCEVTGTIAPYRVRRRF